MRAQLTASFGPELAEFADASSRWRCIYVANKLATRLTSRLLDLRIDG